MIHCNPCRTAIHLSCCRVINPQNNSILYVLLIESNVQYIIPAYNNEHFILLSGELVRRIYDFKSIGICETSFLWQCSCIQCIAVYDNVHVYSVSQCMAMFLYIVCRCVWQCSCI